MKIAFVTQKEESVVDILNPLKHLIALFSFILNLIHKGKNVEFKSTVNDGEVLKAGL